MGMHIEVHTTSEARNKKVRTSGENTPAVHNEKERIGKPDVPALFFVEFVAHAFGQHLELALGLCVVRVDQ